MPSNFGYLFYWEQCVEAFDGTDPACCSEASEINCYGGRDLDWLHPCHHDPYARLLHLRQLRQSWSCSHPAHILPRFFEASSAAAIHETLHWPLYLSAQSVNCLGANYLEKMSARWPGIKYSLFGEADTDGSCKERWRRSWRGRPCRFVNMCLPQGRSARKRVCTAYHLHVNLESNGTRREISQWETRLFCPPVARVSKPCVRHGVIAMILQARGSPPETETRRDIECPW